MKIEGFNVELFLETVIEKITGKEVSVSTLGNEVSVNIEGDLYHFDVAQIMEEAKEMEDMEKEEGEEVSTDHEDCPGCHGCAPEWFD